ncbi:hypothetical protein ABGB18_25050 [Nonomuraea sp. B12E4]|uniref:hypothetical protein n=1 Tax=Nonomuraea sp. B12E4 TaxID=3153564 RepID=UPI00325DCC2C
MLWLLLLPFLLANMAGWMCSELLATRPKRFALHRAVTRIAALVVTLNYLLLVSWIPIDYVGYQCGADQRCSETWWLQPFQAMGDLPAGRMALAAVVPLVAIVVLWFVAARSVRRFEAVPPLMKQGLEPLREPGRGAAVLSGLADRRFWHGRRAAARLGAAHTAAGLTALLAWLTHALAVEAGRPEPVGVPPGWPTPGRPSRRGRPPPARSPRPEPIMVLAGMWLGSPGTFLSGVLSLCTLVLYTGSEMPKAAQRLAVATVTKLPTHLRPLSANLPARRPAGRGGWPHGGLA